MDHGHEAYNPFKQLNSQKLRRGKLGHVSHQITLLLTSYMTTSDINHSEDTRELTTTGMNVFRLMSVSGGTLNVL